MSQAPERASRRRKSIWSHPLVIAAVIPAVVGGIFAVVVAVLSRPPIGDPPPDPLPSSAAPIPPGGHAQSSSPAAPIVIDRISAPPLCATFAGSGDVPQGRTLWLAVQSDERKYYFFPVVPESSSPRWTAGNVTLGIPEEKPGEPFTVLAVLATATGDRNIEKLDGNGSRSLPSGVKEEHRIYVKRGANERQCQE